ncbi:guanylate kinase [Geminocystis sp. NIES-3709]|uniref:guanylate kinase n=1 Tax=Geminocystis sp. NIES-3709 TaxID=1617448 RepID=UPI0005FC8E40|nr:guanylate kinase [Geminocystis sp. NIES-3709]BAQ65009.1 guanylate kinase [Geminocystis sp. NIES-3709]
MTQKGKLVVITGPSGVGKGTIVKALRAKYPDFFLSISATTRYPRQGEVDGKDYYFLSRVQFQEMITNDKLLEWAEYTENYYGTPRQPVLKEINKGKVVILEIEVLGAKQVKKSFPSATTIFILPPSIEILEQRLRGRGTDSEEVIIKRLTKAKEELAVTDQFDYQVINDTLETTIDYVESIIKVE